MSKKSHSGLKRALAWMLTVAMMAQGCIVYADDFTSEPDAAVVSEAVSEEADTSTDSDLEFADDGEDTSTDADAPDISDEDITSDTADDQQAADDAAVEDPFSDGSDIATFSDGADAVGDEESDPNVERGSIDIAGEGGQQYSYARLYDTQGYVRYAVGTYPANQSNVTIKVGDKKGMQYWSLYTTSNNTDYKRVSWDSSTTQNSGTYQSGVTWESSDENVAKVVSNSKYGPFTSGMWVEGVGEGTATITSTWKPGSKYSDTIKPVVNSFTVTVTKAADPVEVGQEFQLEGTATTPSQAKSSDSQKIYWGRTREFAYDLTGDGLEICNGKWRAWSETGLITHAFCINFSEMVGTKTENADNTRFRASISSSAASTTDIFLRPCKMPADGIYMSGLNNGMGTVVDDNIVFDRVSTTDVYVYTFCIKDQQKMDTKTYHSKVKFSSDDESIMKVTRQNTDSVQIRAYKAGITNLKAVYQPVDADGNADGDPMTMSVKVLVRGFYIDEKDDEGNNTIQMSLDDDVTTRAINYKVIDSKGESEPTDTLTWSVDNPAIISVDSDGNLKAKAAGEATVTAQYGTSSSNKDTVKVIVKGAGSLNVDNADVKIKKDGTTTVKATATYNGATVSNADIKWESENPEIAAVDNGKITGVSYGATVIKASWVAENGKTYTNTIDVNVVYDGLYVSDTQSEVTLSQGGTMQIVWQLQNMGELEGGKTGSSAGYRLNSDVTWKSADEEMATVDEYGIITAGTKSGQTTVTVSYTQNRNTISKEIKVNVVDCKTVMNGETIEITGTEGVDGGEHTWKNGFYRNGEFWNTEDNINAVGTTATAKVTGKVPATNPVGITHGFYVNLETIEEPCTSSETIRVKVDGANGLYLDTTSIETKVGDARPSISGKVYQDNAAVSDAVIKYSVEDESIARIEAMQNSKTACYVVGVAPGKTVVTATWGEFKATCDVTVTADAQIFLTPSDKLTVKQNDTAAITAKVWDGSKYVDNPEITWKSYNTAVATVDKGVVTGVKKGSVAVVAAWNDVESDPLQITVVPSRTVSLTTEWDDAENQDAVRPEKTTVQLTANGEKSGDPVELTADADWKYDWKLLAAEDEEGTNIVYRVTADAPEGYTAKVTGSADDGFVVTYSHECEKVDVTASVNWDDAENQDGIRPTVVTLQLKADGANVGDAITVKADADGNWTKTWTNLTKNKAGAVGQAVEYTVEESGLPEGYTQATTGTAADGFTITNSHTPKGVDITVSVNWDDADNQDGIRPDSVEAELYADNVSTNKKVKLTADSDWKATFEKLAVNKNGKAINYTLSATKVDGYTSTTTGSGAEGLVLNYTHDVGVKSPYSTLKILHKFTIFR